ncbi:hypothetical protein CVV38_01735 [Candidatus Peregrinibacteria bacterium HGW-Peregrinibacteria-1]|jgi:glycosyltransferase involved in cell wall biosynthesis|nr:MAG: hypothetical protein CVV38_01735 [Candidatus Peregrinibacteria bacterium HGW-Peregrinibacteria-1]
MKGNDLKEILVGVNGWFLSEPFTGIGRYSANLIVEVENENPSKKIVDDGALALGRYDWEVSAKKLVATIRKMMSVGDDVKVKFLVITKEKLSIPGVNVVALPTMKGGSAGLKKLWWEQVQLPRLLKKYDVDLCWFPYPANPWSKSFYKNRKVMVTVHDCIPWKDRRYSNGVFSKLKNRIIKRSVKFADKVLTVSAHSKQDIEAVCDVDKCEIEIIYNGVDRKIYNADGGKDDALLLDRLGLVKGKYYMYAGGYDPRKNVPLLVKMWKEFVIGGVNVFSERDFENEKLVLVGAENQKAFLEKNTVEVGHVVATKFLSEKELAILYRNCGKFISLSGDEGFNIPVLEALCCGAKVLISDIEVHRELFGDMEGVEILDISKFVN